MALYEIGKEMRNDNRKPVTTISIYVEDKPAFTRIKGMMMETCKDYNDPDVTGDLISSWLTRKNDPN